MPRDSKFVIHFQPAQDIIPYKMRKIWSSVLHERRNQLSFFLVIVLFAAAMGMTTWTLSQYRAHNRSVFALQDCGASIRYYDEVLTMSARLGALTGAPEWERRYEDVVPLLDQALARALELSPASREPLDQVDDHNQRLIAAERQAFALARADRREEAVALVLGEAYEVDKRRYAAGLERFMADLDQASLALELRLARSLWILAAIDALLFLVIAALLLDAFRRQAQYLTIERALGEVARRLVAPGQHGDEEIGWALGEVIDLAGGDFGLLVRYGVSLSSPPKRVWLPNGPADPAPAMVQRLLQRVAVQAHPLHGPLVWPAIRQLSTDACPFQTPLLAAGIESLLGVGLDLGEGVRLWLLVAARRAQGWQANALPLLESALGLLSRAIATQDHEERLFRLATTDALTGLLNRRYFLDKLTEELKRLHRGEAGAVLLTLDIDFFKAVNDTHGHAAGDRVLRHFAFTLKASLRDIDLIGRLGGEEFGILLPGTDPATGLMVAERLREAVALSPARVRNTDLPITVSIGLTDLDPADDHIDQPLQRADQALYAAKGAGRNGVRALPRREVVHEPESELSEISGPVQP